MANEKLYIVDFAIWFGKALGKSGAQLFANFHTDSLGKSLPSTILNSPVAQTAATSAGDLGLLLDTAADNLSVTLASGDDSALVQGFAQYVQAIVEYIDAIDDLMDVIDSAISSGAILNPAERASAEEFMSALPRKILDFMIVSAVEMVDTRILFWLKVVGIAEWKYVEVDEADAISRSHVIKELHLERMKDLFSDPIRLLESTIGWGTVNFDPNDIFQIVSSFNSEENEFSLEEVDGDLVYTKGFFSIRKDSVQSPPGLLINLSDSVEETFDLVEPINDDWNITNQASITFAGGISAKLAPPFSITVVPDEGEVSGEFRLFVNRNEDRRPFDVIGGNGLINLSMDDISFGVGLDASWDVVDEQATINPLIFSDIKGATLRIGSDDSDSFIGGMLSASEIQGQFDLGLEWRLDQGLQIKASGGIEIALPIHIDLGFVELNTFYIALNIKDSGTLSLETSAGFTGKLGALTAIVERLGAELDLTFPENGKARLGPFDSDLHFKPPTGVGLSVDAGVVKGGGYLRFDPDREEYAGALELVFSEWIAVKAIGMITTKMPDGSKGFSLLLIITAEFGTGYQLGLGFTLLGVGGILGLNRIVNIDPLKDGVRTGAVESVMFPEDVIANAPRIISDLRQFFPPQKDIFLVGPMAKIGWGTPPVMKAQLGVILEFPSINITILGVVKIILPDEEEDILRLQVNFVGRIEPSNKLLWFYGELFESRVLFITLEGGFGLLVNWGDKANFVLTAGGFHPEYSPPPLPFPQPPRISVPLLSKPNARVMMKAYFAVTSNSVQFGAMAKVFFGTSEFKIEGHLGFDALFQFDPFYFKFGLSINLSVKVFGVGLYTVGFSGLLEGPTPWHIKGKGKIGFWLFTLRVPFEHIWGGKQDTKLDPIEIFPLIEKEFHALTNWEARVPESSNLLVSLRKMGESASDQLVLHPVGKLRISQRKIPMDLKLDKVGNQRPSDVNRLNVDASLPGISEGLSVSKVEDKFAIGQFKDLDDSKKLSSSGFQPLKSGIEIGVAGEQMKTSRAVRRTIRYETIIIDNNFKRHVKPFFGFLVDGYAVLNNFLFTHFLKGNAVSKSVLSKHQKTRLQPFEEVIQIVPNQFSVAYNTDNRPVDDEATTFTSQAKALDHMERQIQNDAVLARQLHVIPNTELNIAA